MENRLEISTIPYGQCMSDKDFDLDNSSFVDRNLVLSLINYDIMLERIKANLQNEDGMTVQEIFAGVSEQGEEFTKPEILPLLSTYIAYAL